MHDLPSQIGRYQILGLLGTGGMAEVFIGHAPGGADLARPVVIKRILPHLAREKHFRDMFVDEARLVAAIRHPNVVDVAELNREGPELFMVMEYLEGESAAGLTRRLSSEKKLLSFGLSTYIAAAACRGLHAAHELTDDRGRPQNLVHRDVSPANIFVTYAGAVKVLDFGIAVARDRISRTEAGQVKGKFAYMSPEQCKGKPVDRRADLFSLGTVLYELSTCRRLFKRDRDMLTLQAICSEDVIPPSKLVPRYPPTLERVVMKALSKRPEDRYQSALEMERDLQEASRELNFGRQPEAALARVMQKLFADRAQQKERLRTRVAAGRGVSQVPVAKTDPSVDLPPAAFAEGFESAASLSEASLPTTRRPRRGWYLGAAAAAGVLLVVGSASFVAGRYDVEAPTPVPTPVPAPSPAAAAPAAISMAVVSEPAGARVEVNGEPRGETPLELTLPRADAPVTLSLDLDGYAPVERRVVPNGSRKLHFVLGRASDRPAPRRRPRGVRPAAPPKEAEDRYRRFD